MLLSVNLIAIAIANLVSRAVAAPSPSVPHAAFEYPYGTSDVSIISTLSDFKEIPGSRGYVGNINVVVNLAVRNKSFKKLVGVRYSNSSWASQYEAFGSYQGPLDNGFELWTVSIPRGQHVINEVNPEYELAGFASFDAAPREWDPQNNRFVYYKATPATPLASINDGLSYDNSTKMVILTGSARTYSANRAADYKSGNVVVRWTVDDWATSQDALASPPTDPKTDAWTWNIPVSGIDPFAQYAEYKLVYKGVSPEFGLNYPFYKRVTTSYYSSISNGTVLSENHEFTYVVYGDLPFAPAAGFLDGKPVNLVLYGNTYHYFMDLEKISNGNHTLELAVGLQNGPLVHTEMINFVVEKKQ
ncbi:hypothetical protein HDU97_009287 [Phlyctochytrium planicorne]|nr:hypothetical protein HDU97_009287 [Phlyctochytrium planicorne]